MSLDFADLLLEVIERNASDLHLTPEPIRRSASAAA